MSITEASGWAGMSLGAATNPMTKAVEDTVRRVPDWSGRRIEYAPVFGGLLNSNWRVRVDGADDYFVKIPGPGSESFIDRVATHIAAKRAGEVGISARQIAFFSDTGVEVIEFLDGYRACTNGDMKKSEIITAVMGVQNAFHAIEPLPLTKTIFDMIDEQISGIDSTVPVTSRSA